MIVCPIITICIQIHDGIANLRPKPRDFVRFSVRRMPYGPMVFSLTMVGTPKTIEVNTEHDPQGGRD